MSIKITCNECGTNFYRNRIGIAVPCPKCKGTDTEPTERKEVFKKKRRINGETDEAYYR